MKTKLEQLTTVKKELAEMLKLYRKNHALWAKWLHYAKTQPWFDDWAYEQAMRPSDLKADPRYISAKHQDVVPDFAYTMGAIYYSERHSYAVRLDSLRQQRGKLMRDLWTERTSNGGWAYSLAEIAKAYGASQDATYKALKVNEWFRPRKSPGQTHIPKSHLKSLKIT